MVDERLLEQELLQFERATKFVIDSSTAIRLAEFQLLQVLTKRFNIYVLPSVQDETGTEVFLETQGILVNNDLDIKEPGLLELSTDDQLIAFSKTHSCALLSEDRRVLQKAEQIPIPAYPFGILLSLLVYHGVLSYSAARDLWQGFDTRYSYRQDLRQYCQDLLDYVRRSI